MEELLPEIEKWRNRSIEAQQNTSFGKAVNFTPSDERGMSSNAYFGGVAYLSGAVEFSWPITTILMRDDLRIKGLVPYSSPYIDSPKTISNPTQVLSVTGQNAIVDWVLIELLTKDQSIQSPYNPYTIEHSFSALLQRDGDIVDTDGVSSLNLGNLSRDYYVSIRHRNHHGCMTKYPVSFGVGYTQVDFTNPYLETYVKSNGFAVGSFNLLGRQMLFSANVGGSYDLQTNIYNGQWESAVNDFVILYNGIAGGGDRAELLHSIFLYQVEHNLTPLYSNFIIYDKYSSMDTNLDGNISYYGPDNDVDPIFFSVLLHPNNTNGLFNYFVSEAIPGSGAD